MSRRIGSKQRKAIVLAASAALAGGFVGLAAQSAKAIPIFYQDNFDSDTPGQLPAGWSASSQVQVTGLPPGPNSGHAFLVGTTHPVSSPNAFIEADNLSSFTGTGSSTIAAVRDTATVSAPIGTSNFIVS